MAPPVFGFIIYFYDMNRFLGGGEEDFAEG